MLLIGSTGLPPLPPPGLRRRWRRRLPRWRRPLAAVCVALAAALAVHAASASRAAATGAHVLVAAHDLGVGHALAARDVREVAVPRPLVPAGALPARPARVTGRSLSGAVRRGEVMTDARLTGAGQLVGLGPGLLAVPVDVSSLPGGGLVVAGSAVAVLAGTDGGSGPGAGGAVLVTRARVLAVQSTAGSSSLLGGGSGSGTVVILALTRAQAARVTGAVGQRTIVLALTA